MYSVLVVDDDKDILTVVELILKASGFEVKVTNQWQQVFPSIIQFHPDIILLDISLGGEDGRNISKQIKSNKTTEHIPVVLFSANYNASKNLANSFADDFIAKPFEANALVQTLLDHLPVHA